jgi:RNA polymerase sigma-70 factor, ECF subfamily
LRWNAAPASGVRRFVSDRQPLSDFIPRLRRYARALLSPQVSPDDLVRETLERAAQELHYYAPQRDSRVRLFTLMHQVYVRQMRAGAFGQTLEQPPTAAREGEPSFLEDFDRAITVLPPEQREVFLLVTIEEMTYEDVAKTLGIPIGTVMSRLSRAREKLRALLLGHARLKAVK